MDRLKLADTASLFEEFDIRLTDEDLQRYLDFPDSTRIIAAESLVERAKQQLAFGIGTTPGLRLPWPEIESDVRITPGTLAVWSGLTHHGKSQMLKQVMLGAISQDEKVCFASLEENVLQLFLNMGQMGCGTQEPSLRQFMGFVDFCVKKLWFYDHEGIISGKRMGQVIRWCAAEKGVTQFVVDSLMLVSVAKGYDKFSGHVDFVAELKAIAKETGCTIHLVAHNKKPQGKASEAESGGIHDISGGHEIGSMADYVFSVWRNKKLAGERGTGERDAKLIVEKQRGQFNWIGTFPLDFHFTSRQFVRGYEPMKFWEPRQRETGEDAVEL